MNKFRAVFADTLLEVRARKIFYLYWLVTLVVIVFLFLIPNLTINGADLLESGAISPEMIDQAVSRFFDGYFGFIILLMVFGSAGLLPSFLSKGRIELTLSKPISRHRLLALKFISVFIIMCVILALSTTLIWGAISIRLGSASLNFFLGLLLSLVQFFAVYSIVFVFGVAANSGAVAIMGYFIIRVGTTLLAGRGILYEFLGDSIWKKILDGAYHIMPKIGELASNYIPLMRGQGIADTYPVYSTVAISVVLILVAMLVFSRKDY